MLEETGYNLAGQIDPADVIEVSIREQQVTLFVVPGIPEDYAFETKTRKEISVRCSLLPSANEARIDRRAENRLVQAERSADLEAKQDAW